MIKLTRSKKIIVPLGVIMLISIGVILYSRFSTISINGFFRAKRLLCFVKIDYEGEYSRNISLYSRGSFSNIYIYYLPGQYKARCDEVIKEIKNIAASNLFKKEEYTYNLNGSLCNVYCYGPSGKPSYHIYFCIPEIETVIEYMGSDTKTFFRFIDTIKIGNIRNGISGTRTLFDSQN